MNLSELRGSMTQVELAKALHISRSSLIKYEHGERTPRDNIKSALPPTSARLYKKSSTMNKEETLP